MKTIHNIVYLFSLLLLSGCGPQFSEVLPVATFSEPQPGGGKSLERFPSKIQGTYVDKDSSYSVRISDQFIVRFIHEESIIHPSQVDSSWSYKGDTLIEKETGLHFPFKRTGDSMTIYFNYSDTLNALGQGQVLKKFKGYYFISTGNKEDGWAVKRLSLQKGMLISAYISDSSALTPLKALTEQPQDTIRQLFSVKKKNFRSLLRQDVFINNDTLFRMR